MNKQLNSNEILRWLVINLLTDSQLDVKLPYELGRIQGVTTLRNLFTDFMEDEE